MSAVLFSDCLVSDCSKELCGQLMEECSVKLLAGVRTFCLNPDYLSSLKGFYLIWFNILSRLWGILLLLSYQTILLFLSVCQSLVLGSLAGKARYSTLCELLYSYFLPWFAVLSPKLSWHSWQIAMIVTSTLFLHLWCKFHKKCFDRDVLFLKGAGKQDNHPFFPLIPKINRSTPFLVGITGMSGSWLVLFFLPFFPRIV